MVHEQNEEILYGSLNPRPLPYGLSRRYAKISIAKPDTFKYLVDPVSSGQLALSMPRVTFDRFDHDLEEKTCSLLLLLRFIYFW